MTNTKHPITPHKGGRTQWPPIRATPETMRMLRAICHQTGESMGDAFVRLIKQEYDLQAQIRAAQAKTDLTDPE